MGPRVVNSYPKAEGISLPQIAEDGRMRAIHHPSRAHDLIESDLPLPSGDG